MYPYLRLAKLLLVARFRSRLRLADRSDLSMRVWPGDLDAYPEQNNGRHLTLMDLGRYDFAVRCGLYQVARERRWAFVVAGASARFRHRLRPFQRYILSSKMLGHDGRFFYFHQFTVSGGVGGKPRLTHSSALVRGALARPDGLVPIAEIAEALGAEGWDLPLPEWAQAWASVENLRPWPPHEHEWPGPKL
ncbi:MAG: thioesterase family protein [Planctomycetes bacterium]|nr:thioesterase family protein [Planctomycetota bacterium]